MEDASGSQPVLVKELERFDIEYQREVLRIASLGVRDNPAVFSAWEKVYKKSKGERQAEVLAMLSRGSTDPCLPIVIWYPLLTLAVYQFEWWD